jgi:integrase
MKEAQPLRDERHIDALIESLTGRDLLLFLVGIRSAYRVSDIVPLKLGTLRHDSHYYVIETKTGKTRMIKIDDDVRALAREMPGDDGEYAFKSREGENQPITRQQVDRILKAAQQRANALLKSRKQPIIERPISAHTMRKTFGYHYYTETLDVATLIRVYNHSSSAMTLAYIGITQDTIDDAVDVVSKLGKRALAKRGVRKAK